MRSVLFAVAVCLTGTLWSNPDVASAKSTGEENRRKVMEKVGGFIQNKRVAEGCVAVIDAQNRLPADVIRKRADVLEANVWMTVKYSKEGGVFSLARVDDIVKSSGGNVAIIVIDDQSMPALMSVPESRCSIVNIAALAKDAPDEIKLHARFSKEMSRAYAFALVLAYSGRPGGVMDPITSLKELDRIYADKLGMDILPFAEKSAERFGIKKFKRTTYKTACEEGWAPPPANEFQKAIWDEVHALPSKPIEIEPEKAPLKK